jgi:hypothetical protein
MALLNCFPLRHDTMNQSLPQITTPRPNMKNNPESEIVQVFMTLPATLNRHRINESPRTITLSIDLSNSDT